MEKIIEHNFGKEESIRLAKKAMSGKFAIIKDEGDVLKAGAPTAPVKIEFFDSKIVLSGKILSNLFVTGIANEIELFFDEYKNNNSQANNVSNNDKRISTEESTKEESVDKSVDNQVKDNSPKSNNSYSLKEYFDYQEKGIAIIKSYKELLDSDIITQEEFNEKKTEILNFIKGIMEM